MPNPRGTFDSTRKVARPRPRDPAAITTLDQAVAVHSSIAKSAKKISETLQKGAEADGRIDKAIDKINEIVDRLNGQEKTLKALYKAVEALIAGCAAPVRDSATHHVQMARFHDPLAALMKRGATEAVHGGGKHDPSHKAGTKVSS